MPFKKQHNINAHDIVCIRYSHVIAELSQNIYVIRREKFKKISNGYFKSKVLIIGLISPRDFEILGWSPF